MPNTYPCSYILPPLIKTFYLQNILQIVSINTANDDFCNSIFTKIICSYKNVDSNISTNLSFILSFNIQNLYF